RAGAGGARRDLAAYVGAQFTNCGYGITVKGLPPGAYQIVAFAHSTVSGTFAAAASVVVTLSATPLMSIDTPGSNQTVGSSFLVAGWATDLAATSGSGVDAIHIYRDPTSP